MNLCFLLPEGQDLHQTTRQNIKLIFHSAPTPVRQIYVDIPSINGWKIDGIWCPWVEHEAAGGIVDTSAIFGRSPVLSYNLGGQPTDALLYALVWSGEMESRWTCHRNVLSLLCVKSLYHKETCDWPCKQCRFCNIYVNIWCINI